MSDAEFVRAFFAPYAGNPDTLIAGPVMYGAVKALANLPPNTDRRKVKRLLRKAMRLADGPPK